MRQLEFISIRMFGDDFVTSKHYKEGAMLIKIQPSFPQTIANVTYRPARIYISSDSLGYVNIDIDNFHWEYDNQLLLAKSEIRKLLQAVVDDKLRIKKTFLSEKLEILN